MSTTAAIRTPANWRDTDPGIVDRLLRGSIDLHCHSGPSVMSRYFDHIEALEEAASVGIRALLLKDHCYSVTPVTELLNKHYGHHGVELLSGVPLNNPVGGLNIHAVDHGIRLGARLIWMPTYCAANHIDYHASHPEFVDQFPKTKTLTVPPSPITILDDAGRLKEEVLPILDLIAEADVVLSSGHLHISEIWVLFEEAKRRGIKRLLCNHPTFIIGADVDDVRRLSEMGVYVEHSSCMFTPGNKYAFFDPEQLQELITAAGIERTILGSDLGIFDGFKLVEGSRAVIEVLLDVGYSEDDIRLLTRTNAARLMGIDVDAE
ncbi:DUF6282 family protein [Microbaculum marinum]|uniref:DUF6282 family protein n=1 Tax=Microbaculum marinum TaxID=1764581 RepID=A0AAW9RB88_9HYPH